MRKYRWIMYLQAPLGSWDVKRIHSLADAKSALLQYGRDTGFHQDLQSSGQYGCSGYLYPYSDEDWEEAEKYREIGNPFDYPSKLVENGPRGGVNITNA